jgi:hypothetical protein
VSAADLSHLAELRALGDDEVPAIGSDRHRPSTVLSSFTAMYAPRTPS